MYEAGEMRKAGMTDASKSDMEHASKGARNAARKEQWRKGGGEKVERADPSCISFRRSRFEEML